MNRRQQFSDAVALQLHAARMEVEHMEYWARELNNHGVEWSYAQCELNYRFADQTRACQQLVTLAVELTQESPDIGRCVRALRQADELRLCPNAWTPGIQNRFRQLQDDLCHELASALS